jgi:hypothetical protein
MAGYDTAAYLYETVPPDTEPIWEAAPSQYGSPLFWIRYFSPSPNGTVDSSESNAREEFDAAYNSGAHYMGVVSSPHQARLASNSEAEGVADAQTLSSAIYTTYHYVGLSHFSMPSQLYCWLDQEPTTPLTLNYWYGWSAYVDSSEWPPTSTYPLYPCLYCQPCADNTYPNCTILANPSSPTCFAIWSQQPQECGNSVSNPPLWFAYSCATTSCPPGQATNGFTGTPTNLWQFNTTAACSTVGVDMDLGSPGFYYPSYCIGIPSAP